MMFTEELTVERIIEFGQFTLQLPQRVLRRGEVRVRIGSRALELLMSLLDSAGTTMLKASLIARTWPNSVVEEGTLRVHISNLRKTLGDGQGQQRYIESVTGQGYRFVATVRVHVPLRASAHRGLSERYRGQDEARSPCKS